MRSCFRLTVITQICAYAWHVLFQTREWHRMMCMAAPPTRRFLPFYLNSVYTIQPVVKLVVKQPVGQPAASCKQTSNRLSYRLTTGWMFVYTIQLVVQPVIKPPLQPVWQQVVSCKRGFTLLVDVPSMFSSLPQAFQQSLQRDRII